MSKKKVDQVDEFFDAIESFVRNAGSKFPFKIQIERDRRGKPVLGVRVKEVDVESEMMKTLRYPQ